MKINVGGSPVAAQKSEFWKPVDGKDNLVVLLSNVDPEGGDVVWSDKVVKMFTNSKFGKSYRVNATWVYFGAGNGDPVEVLAPEMLPNKLGYTALIMVSYKDGDEWKLGIWQVSSAVHRALVTANQVNDTQNKYILVKKEGKNWGVTVAGKMKVPSEALTVVEKIPSQEEQARIIGDYETVDEVWELLRNRSGANTNDEVINLFNGGAELL